MGIILLSYKLTSKQASSSSLTIKILAHLMLLNQFQAHANLGVKIERILGYIHQQYYDVLLNDHETQPNPIGHYVSVEYVFQHVPYRCGK